MTAGIPAREFGFWTFADTLYQITGYRNRHLDQMRLVAWQTSIVVNSLGAKTSPRKLMGPDWDRGD